MNTARPLTDLTDSVAAQGQLDVIVVPGDEDAHYHGCSACCASWTATMNDDTPSKAHAGQTNCNEQLTTTTSMMLTDMSAADNTRHRAVPDNDDGSVHKDHAICTTTCHMQHTTRLCLTIGINTTMGAASKHSSLAAPPGAANNQQANYMPSAPHRLLAAICRSHRWLWRSRQGPHDA